MLLRRLTSLFHHTFHTDILKLKLYQLFCVFFADIEYNSGDIPIRLFREDMPKRKKPVEGKIDGSREDESKKQKNVDFRTIIKLKRKSRRAVSCTVNDNSPRNEYLMNMNRIETGEKRRKFYVQSEMQHDFFERSRLIAVKTHAKRRLCFTLNGQKNPRSHGSLP